MPLWRGNRMSAHHKLAAVAGESTPSPRHQPCCSPRRGSRSLVTRHCKPQPGSAWSALSISQQTAPFGTLYGGCWWTRGSAACFVTSALLAVAEDVSCLPPAYSPLSFGGYMGLGQPYSCQGRDPTQSRVALVTTEDVKTEGRQF